MRMGTEGAYPPYNFINDAGEVDGFERELGDELCKRAALTCEWVHERLGLASSRTCSRATMTSSSPGMSITDERDKVIDFSQNYIPPAASAYLALTAGCRHQGRRGLGAGRHHPGRLCRRIRRDAAGIRHARRNRRRRAQRRGGCGVRRQGLPRADRGGIGRRAGACWRTKCSWAAASAWACAKATPS